MCTVRHEWVNEFVRACRRRRISFISFFFLFSSPLFFLLLQSQPCLKEKLFHIRSISFIGASYFFSLPLCSHHSTASLHHASPYHPSPSLRPASVQLEHAGISLFRCPFRMDAICSELWYTTFFHQASKNVWKLTKLELQRRFTLIPVYMNVIFVFVWTRHAHTERDFPPYMFDDDVPHVETATSHNNNIAREKMVLPLPPARAAAAKPIVRTNITEVRSNAWLSLTLVADLPNDVVCLLLQRMLCTVCIVRRPAVSLPMPNHFVATIVRPYFNTHRCDEYNSECRPKQRRAKTEKKWTNYVQNRPSQIRCTYLLRSIRLLPERRRKVIYFPQS